MMPAGNKMRSHIFLLIITSVFMASCSSQMPRNAHYLNDEVVKEVEKLMGEKVGRGECWDLAQHVLDKLGANWTRLFNYGRKLDKSEPYKPGDIIQFKSVKTEWKTKYAWGSAQIGMPDHTAIIWQVESNLKFQVAHQNYNNIRKVGLGDIDLTHMVSGRYQVYRPYR